VKISRRLGIALTPKAAKVMERKPNPPGQHGSARQRKPSDFKRQLLEKQRLRYQYNISEKQMTTYYLKAASKTGATTETLIQLLEARLDAFVHRAGFAPTIYAARQYINHGHMLVNGKKVDIPSYQLKVGDQVTVKEKSRSLPNLQEGLKQGNPPAYITVSPEQFTARLNAVPQREEVPVICEMSLVIEYYSR
jgi:small subunit ribosomal protein S4